MQNEARYRMQRVGGKVAATDATGAPLVYEARGGVELCPACAGAEGHDGCKAGGYCRESDSERCILGAFVNNEPGLHCEACGAVIPAKA